MPTTGLAIYNGTSAEWVFPTDSNWSSFTLKEISFSLDESVSNWDYYDCLSFNISIGGRSVTSSPVVVSRQYGDSGSSLTLDFMSFFGQNIEGISPGSTIRVYFVRNDRNVWMTSASITYESIEKSYKWLKYNGKKLYKRDDLIWDETVTSSTSGTYYVTANDYIWKILGHMDWSITSDYVLVTLPASYRSDVKYYTGEIHPLYVYT